jgi:ABC-type lipoprotein export system ATPase subunit
MSELMRLENIFKWVGEGEGRTEILKGISLTLQAGEFTAIMGASGSGKSTLLNLIGLLDTPSAGSLKMLGKETSHLTEDELAKVRAHAIGFIFQSFNLLPYLTARQNVELPMGYTRQADKHERSRRLLAQMHLDHRENAYPATLSGGEKQRVAIARSLANEPPVLLADEPTGALDSKTGKEVMDLLSALNRGGATVLLVTHDETVARRAQRIMRMKDGRFE